MSKPPPRYVEQQAAFEQQAREDKGKEAAWSAIQSAAEAMGRGHGERPCRAGD